MRVAAITIRDDEELRQALGELGQAVGPRKGPGRRTKDQKEWFCLRRYLLTLASRGRLPYPVTIEKADPPDFLIHDSVRGSYGVEITEATEQDWQRELTVTEIASEVEDAATPLFVGMDDGWVGNQPEAEWCSAVIRAIAAKVESIERLEYLVGRCDLLIYENSRSGVVVKEKAAIAGLMQAVQPLKDTLRYGERLGVVSLLTGSCLLYDVLGDALELSVVR